MLAVGFLFAGMGWAMEGPILLHQPGVLEAADRRETLDTMLVELGYASAQWMTPAQLAATFDVHSIQVQEENQCTELVELRVWLERLDRMEMRIQILDIPTALELGERLWQDQVCLQEVPSRRGLQRLLVNTARAQWLEIQTLQSEQEVGEALVRRRPRGLAAHLEVEYEPGHGHAQSRQGST